MSHLIYVSAVQKTIEEWQSAADETKVDKNDRVSLQNDVDLKVESLKSRSIDYLLRLHPPFYRDALRFEDWDSAVAYIDDNRDVIVDFWKGKDK